MNVDLDCRKAADMLAADLSETHTEYPNEDEVFVDYSGSWDAVVSAAHRLFKAVRLDEQNGRLWVIIPCIDQESTYELAIQPEADGFWLLFVNDSRP